MVAAPSPGALAPPGLAPAPNGSPSGPFVVQRAPEGPAAEPSPSAAAGADNTGPTAPDHQAAKGDEDVDELSRRLYDRIRDRLKAELYLDRERAGQLSDLTV
jgi:hypothetical protein